MRLPKTGSIFEISINLSRPQKGVRNDPSIRNLVIIFKLSPKNRFKSRFLSEIECKTSEQNV